MKFSDIQLRHLFLLLLVGGLGLVTSIGAFIYNKQLQTDVLASNFTQLAQAESDQAQQLINHSTGLLLSFRGLFASADEVSRQQYRGFTAALLQRHPEITAVHWAKRVPDRSRLGFEAELKRQGLAPYGIFDIEADARNPVRAAVRDEYLPITYAEPLEPNKVVIGLDVFERPFNKRALSEARQMNSQYTTSAFPIMQDPDGPLAVAIYQPIYDQTGVRQTRQQRINGLQGFVILMLRPEILLESLHLDPDLFSGVRLLDVNSTTESEIFSYPAISPKAHSIEPIRLELLIPGRQWVLELAASRKFEKSADQLQPFLLLLALLVLMIVTLALLTYALRQTRHLEVSNRQLRESREQLDNLAHHDHLTGLVNRRMLEKVVQQTLDAESLDKRSAICLMDLDNFKPINDRYGHDTGDVVLQIIASRLDKAVRTTDTVARHGGDEFVIFLPGVGTHDEVELALQRLMDICSEPICLPDLSDDIVITPSIGAILFDHQGAGFDQLLRRADEMMYEAKKDGKGEFRVQMQDRVA